MHSLHAYNRSPIQHTHIDVAHVHIVTVVFFRILTMIRYSSITTSEQMVPVVNNMLDTSFSKTCSFSSSSWSPNACMYMYVNVCRRDVPAKSQWKMLPSPRPLACPPSSAATQRTQTRAPAMAPPSGAAATTDVCRRHVALEQLHEEGHARVSRMHERVVHIEHIHIHTHTDISSHMHAHDLDATRSASTRANGDATSARMRYLVLHPRQLSAPASPRPLRQAPSASDAPGRTAATITIAPAPLAPRAASSAHGARRRSTSSRCSCI